MKVRRATCTEAQWKALTQGPPIQTGDLRMTAKIPWLPRRLRLAVYHSREGPWIAACTRSYIVAQGESPIDAIRALFRQCAMTELLATSQRRRGDRVIRWRPARGAETEIARIEHEATSKGGLILDAVDWRRSSPMFMRGMKWRNG